MADGLRGPVFAGPENNGKCCHSLSWMDGGSRNVCGAGRSGHQQAVRFVQKMWMSVGVVYVLYNFRGIEQDHDVVREDTDSVDAELFFGKQDRTRFRNAQGRANDRKVNAAGIGPAGEVFRLSVAGILGNRRTDNLRIRESLPQELFKIRRRLCHYFSAEFFQRGRELFLEIERLTGMKFCNSRQFTSRGLVVANILQDSVAKAHRL